jgi:hypothetical protein
MTSKLTRALVIALTFACLGSVPSFAQEGPCTGSDVLVAFDLSTEPAKVVVRQRATPQADLITLESESDAVAAAATPAAFAAAGAGAAAAVAGAEASLQRAWNTVTARGDECEARWITKTAEGHHLLTVVALARTLDDIEIIITETKRKTRFGEDIATLLKVLPLLPAKALGDPTLRAVVKQYELAEVRANVAIVVQKSTAGIAGEQLAKTDLITGPSEHLALSADAVVENFDDVKRNDDGTVDVKETPDEFLLGLDYYVGDLLTDWGSGDFVKGIGVKFLVEASRDPGNQVGVALTWRGDAGPLSLKLISPWAGLLWTRSEDLDADGNVVGRGDLFEGSPDFVAGLSFNLDRALEWLKPES